VTDVDRFEDMFARHAGEIASYCRWRASCTADAQDAASEVFLAAWRRLDDVPDGDRARVWLYATARRVIANQRRSHRRREALDERLALEAATIVEQPEADGAMVVEALRRVHPGDREVLLLAEWQGLTPTEIASILGCLPVTARGRLHRARQRFRTAFEHQLALADEDPDPRPTSPTTRPPISAPQARRVIVPTAQGER
jgi:RNA polymerase sigma factor (sigma-70 family)